MPPRFPGAAWYGRVLADSRHNGLSDEPPTPPAHPRGRGDLVRAVRADPADRGGRGLLSEDRRQETGDRRGQGAEKRPQEQPADRAPALGGCHEGGACAHGDPGYHVEHHVFFSFVMMRCSAAARDVIHKRMATNPVRIEGQDCPTRPWHESVDGRKAGVPHTAKCRAAAVGLPRAHAGTGPEGSGEEENAEICHYSTLLFTSTPPYFSVPYMPVPLGFPCRVLSAFERGGRAGRARSPLSPSP